VALLFITEQYFSSNLNPLKNKSARKNPKRIVDASRLDYELAARSVFVLKST
jgi:hypothetical protein